jgi:hypothetical protein
MDFNYLYHRRGVERLRAETAACAPSRDAHLGLADQFMQLIRRRRRERDPRGGRTDS